MTEVYPSQHAGSQPVLPEASSAVRRFRATTVALLLSSCCWLPVCTELGAQTAEESDAAEEVAVPPLGATPIPERRFDLGLTIPQSRIIDDPSFPYDRLFQNQRIGIDPDFRLGKGHGSVRLLDGSLNVDTQLPILERGSQPTDAKLKLGPLFLDAGSVSTEVLWSDNANQSEENPESGTIGVVRVDALTILLQFSENCRAVLRGDFIALPFENSAGFNGFGITDPWNPSVIGDLDALFQAQLDYQTRLGGWETTFLESFRVEDATGEGNLGLFLGSETDALERVSFDEEDRIGEYSFGDEAGNYYGGSSRRRRRFGDADEDDDLVSRMDTDDIRYVNTVSATAQRLLAGTTRASATIFRTDYQESDNDNTATSVSWRHGIALGLASERLTLRFKPYVTYAATEDSDDAGITHVARLGVRGPITENMTFDGNVGYAREESDTIEEDFLYRLTLAHQPRPDTVHWLGINRQLSEPEGDLTTEFRYGLAQRLGPYCRASLALLWREEEDTGGDDDQQVEQEWGGSIGLSVRPGPKLTLRTRATYTETDLQGGDASRERELLLLCSAGYRIGERTRVRLSYEYTNLDSDAQGKSYRENLVRLMLSYRL